MPRLTRRQLLKSALLASAATATSKLIPSDLAAARTEEAMEVSSANLRERLLLNFGWRFALGHANDAEKDFGYGARRREGQFAKSGFFLPVTRANFDDKAWRAIDLPHDWAVELPFTNAPMLPHQGAKPLGREYPETSVGWYRKLFALSPSDKGKRITVEFDGVFRDAMVMFNGHYLGENFSGYVPFIFDLTDFVNFTEPNVLVVRVDATENEGWFYEGAGIYRHVWLVKTDPLHVTPWGNFISATVQGKSAKVTIKTEVQNESDAVRNCRAVTRILDPSGHSVATAGSKRLTIAPGATVEFAYEATVANPALWSLKQPNLYRAVTSVEDNTNVTDTIETNFGIRTWFWCSR